MDKTIEISRTFRLQSAHRLPNVPEDHKCHRMHGHSWTINIYLTGETEPEMGWVADFADIGAIWRERIHDVLDHRVMNDVIPNPTSENVCMWIYGTLVGLVQAIGLRITEVEVSEDEVSSARLRIDGASK
ncbi:hypothetical protein LCGC14_1640490 [marine sediment metagenome]|uniref:6-pyruvoyl tetrahydrobiopterin synthase n=1 Tax=marine sediment metagenome TaxID=412755 RepID=A0A0F9KZB9_9ZZZZ